MMSDNDKNLYSGIDDKIDNKIKEMVEKIKLPNVANINISEPNLIQYLCDINSKYYMVLLMITNIITPTNSEMFNIINNLIKESSDYLNTKMKIIENIVWPEKFTYKGTYYDNSSYSWYCVSLSSTEILFNINLSSISYSNYFTLIKTFYKTYFYILENYKLTTYDNLHELIKIWYINNSIFSILHHMFEIHVNKTSYEYLFKKEETNSRIHCSSYDNEISSILQFTNSIEKNNIENSKKYNVNISFNLMDRLSIYLKNLILIDANFEYAFMINNDTKNKNIVFNTIINNNYNKNIISADVLSMYSD